MALIELQEDYRAKAMQNIVRAQERQQKQYDRKHNTNTTLKVGDKVLKENSRNQHRMGGKLDNRWTGPFIIHEDLGKGRFRLKTSAGKPLKQTIHCAHLKLYHEPASGSAEPPIPDSANLKSPVKSPVDPHDAPVESLVKPPIDDPDVPES